jgi:hypothetical protein
MAKKNTSRSAQTPCPSAAQQGQNPTFEDKNEAFFRRTREAVEKALFERIAREAYQEFKEGAKLEDVLAWNEKTYLDTDPKMIHKLVLLAHDAFTKGDPCPEGVWSKAPEEPPPLAPKYSDPAEEQDDIDFFYPHPLPNWFLVGGKEKGDGKRPAWLPSGWETDRWPVNDSLEAVEQWLDYLTHGKGQLASFELGGITSAEEYIRDVWRLWEWLRDTGKVPVPYQEVAKAYTPHEALVEVKRLKEQIFRKYASPLKKGEKEEPSPDQREPVILGKPEARPVVLGKEKPPLSPKHYQVVKALVDAAGKLTKTQLVKKSGCGDSVGILHRLAEMDPDWKEVIEFPGEAWQGGYSIKKSF